jgi:hypothetical protein
MQLEVPPGLIPLTREDWQAVLSQHVPAPEIEPPVRRGQRRYGVPLGGWRLLFHDRENHALEVRGTLRNASPTGVMLVCRQELSTNTPVLLAFNDGERECVLTGEIAHCTSTIGGHKVGVRLRFP